MYAVIRAGGQQFKVSPGDIIKLTKSVSHGSNGKVEFGSADVLAVSSEPGQIARPNGNSATVTAEIVDEGRAKKILVFHFKRKKQYKKIYGHRQPFTSVRITEIAFDGERFTAPDLPAAKPKKAKSEEAGEAETKAAKSAKGKSKNKPKAVKKSASKKAGAKGKKK